jgi:hypothetical protein
MAYEPFASRSRAVLIGVAKYEHAGDFANIPSAYANTTALRAALTSDALGRFIPRTVETLAEPCTRDRALEAIRTSVAQAQDLLFCYFTGHGHLDLTGDRPELYLMTRESTKADARLDGIPYTALLQLLAGSRAERVVLVLDCCFAGNAGLVPLPDRPFSLLTSSRVGSRIHKGNGIDPTPFTAALVRVLSEGTHTHDPVTVSTLGIRLGELAAEQPPLPDADHDPWQPTERSSAAAGDTVLSQARRPRPTPAWQRALDRVRRRLRRLAGYCAFAWTWTAGPGQPLWHRVTGGCLALALLTGGVTGYAIANRPAPLCPAPLELRVLSSPETRAALASVLDAFQDSTEATTPLTTDGARPQGCGQINTTVYAAPTDKAIAAFRDSAAWSEPEHACAADDAACRSPLVDVGAHPDIWIPESTAAYTRVLDATRRPESALALGAPHTLARSPVVVAATEDLPGVSQSGSTLAQLVASARAKGMTVRSADPRSSDAALAALLHLPVTGSLRSGAADDRELACQARAGLIESPPQRLALLTSESTVAADVTPGLDSRPPCLGNQTDPYAVYYPRDVPPLDLTYIPVTWETGRSDLPDRSAAVQRLLSWLTSAAGGRHLAAQGFRPASTPLGAPLATYRFHAHPALATGATVPLRRLTGLLQSYAASGEAPRRILFAVDLSTSAYSRGTVDSLLTRATNSLGSTDRYALGAVPGGTVLPLGTHSAGERDDALGRLKPVARDAPIDSTVRNVPGGYSLLVLITDDEDSPRAAQPRAAVPVIVVSLEDFGCALAFNKAVTAHGGACVDTSQDLADGLVEALR